MIETIKGKKVLLLPRVKDTDITKNENLISNTIIMCVNYLKALGAKIVVLDENLEHDVVVSRFSGEDYKDESSIHYKSLNSGKPYFELHWDLLNGVFFHERTGLNGKLEPMTKKDETNSHVCLPDVKIDGQLFKRFDGSFKIELKEFK